MVFFYLELGHHILPWLCPTPGASALSRTAGVSLSQVPEDRRSCRAVTVPTLVSASLPQPVLLPRPVLLPQRVLSDTWTLSASVSPANGAGVFCSNKFRKF